jgi:hypothetical protein
MLIKMKYTFNHIIWENSVIRCAQKTIGLMEAPPRHAPMMDAMVVTNGSNY